MTKAQEKIQKALENETRELAETTRIIEDGKRVVKPTSLSRNELSSLLIIETAKYLSDGNKVTRIKKLGGLRVKKANNVKVSVGFRNNRSEDSMMRCL